MMEENQKDALRKKAFESTRDTQLEFVCEHCGKPAHKRAVLLRNKTLFLCNSCGIRHGKSLRTPEQEKETCKKREETMRSKYGVSNIFQDVGRIQQGLKNKYSAETIEESYKQRHIAIVQGIRAKYGVDNIMQSEEGKQAMRVSLETTYGSVENAYKSRIEKIRETCMERFGVSTNLVTEDNKNQSKKTMLRKWGVDHPMRSPEIKKKFIEDHGSIGAVRKGIPFDDKIFDSKLELCFYIFLKEGGYRDFEYHPISHLVEWKDSKGNPHVYTPDFRVDNQLIEVKGGWAFNEAGDPYNNYSQEFWWEKYNMLIANNVTILREEDLQGVIAEVKKKYPKLFSKKKRT